jgi:hypothetical protein
MTKQEFSGDLIQTFLFFFINLKRAFDCIKGFDRHRVGLFNLQEISTKSVCITVEELARERCLLNEKVGISRFDNIFARKSVLHKRPHREISSIDKTFPFTFIVMI